jgi:hypothetical protein
VKSFIIDVFHYASWFPFSRWLWFPLLSTWVHVLVPRPQLSIPAELGKNKWIHKQMILFYFILSEKLPSPCFLILSLSPLWFNQSIPSYVSTCSVMKRGKDGKLYMLLPMNRHMRSSYFVDLFMGICFHAWIIWFCCFFFMLCNLFIYVETIRIILYLVPVSLGLINFRRRIMDLRGKCPCIVLIRSRPCFVSPNTC